MLVELRLTAVEERDETRKSCHRQYASHEQHPLERDATLVPLPRHLVDPDAGRVFQTRRGQHVRATCLHSMTQRMLYQLLYVRSTGPSFSYGVACYTSAVACKTATSCVANCVLSPKFCPGSTANSSYVCAANIRQEYHLSHTLFRLCNSREIVYRVRSRSNSLPSGSGTLCFDTVTNCQAAGRCASGTACTADFSTCATGVAGGVISTAHNMRAPPSSRAHDWEPCSGRRPHTPLALDIACMRS